MLETYNDIGVHYEDEYGEIQTRFFFSLEELDSYMHSTDDHVLHMWYPNMPQPRSVPCDNFPF